MTVQAIAKIIRETVDADMSQRLHKVDEAATAILAFLSAPQDRDVGALEIAGTALADAAGDIHPTAPSSAAINRLHAAIDAWFIALKAMPSSPSIAGIPDGLAKLLEAVAPTIHALRHYTTNDLKPGEMPGNILLLSDAVAVIALYDALSASPSPVVDAGRKTET